MSQRYGSRIEQLTDNAKQEHLLLKIKLFEAIAVPEALHYSGLLTKLRILLGGKSVSEKKFIFNQKKEERR